MYIYISYESNVDELTGRDWPHGTGHDVLTSLAINVELLVLYVQFDEWQCSVEVVGTVQVAGVHSGVRRGLDVTGLQTTVFKHAVTIGPGRTDEICL